MAVKDPLGLVNTTLQIESRYRIDAVVGRGGFGTVYRANQLNFDEPVAIKVLRYDDHADETAEKIYQSFRNESNILRRLSQECDTFVRVLDMGITRVATGGYMPYYVMEWLEGRTLRDDLIERAQNGLTGRTMADVVRLLGPIAEALGVAHGQEQRIAHRDIKPENIFLARTATSIKPKLLDFGIAKVMLDTGTLAHRQGTQVGLHGAASPNYYAPEQAYPGKYGATGPWTDVYALALVAVELLSDAPALDGGDDPIALALATCDKDKRPTPNNQKRGTRVSSRMESIFDKALAIQPRERYQNAKAFWDDLVKQADKEGLLDKPGKVVLLTKHTPGAGSDVAFAKTALGQSEAAGPRNATTLALLAAFGMAVIGFIGFFAGRASTSSAASNATPVASASVQSAPPATPAAMEQPAVGSNRSISRPSMIPSPHASQRARDSRRKDVTVHLVMKRLLGSS